MNETKSEGNEAIKSDEDIENDIYKLSELENLIFECTESSLEKAKSLFHFFDQKVLFFTLISALYRRDLHYKEIGDLVELCEYKSKEMPATATFAQYLYLRGIIELITSDTLTFDTIDFYEEPVKPDTLEFLIKNDDLTNYVDYITINNIKENSYSISILYSFIFKIPEFACYVNALNIVKYLIINNKTYHFDMTRPTTIGGSDSVMEFLLSQGFNFQGHLWEAISYHQNNIAKWIYENYDKDKFPLPICVESRNTEMFLYFINEHGYDINMIDQYQRSCLHWAVERENIYIIRYSIMKGIDTKIKDTMGHPAIDYSHNEQIKELISKLSR